MKRLLSSLSVSVLIAGVANAQVYINEYFANAPGTDGGNEYFELRGTPSLSLAGYYLLSIEGQGAAGDINQFFDLGAFSIGANGYLFGQQFGSSYVPLAGATVLSNSISPGWGQAAGAGSTVGHSGDGTQTDLENSATTAMLINIGIGIAPTLSTDLDTDNDGVLDLPAGWTVIDSVGVLDGVSGAVSDFSYGLITLRLGGLGTNVLGNVIDVPGTGTAFYVGRIGDSTGSTASDWFGSVVSGSSSDPLNFVLSSASDPRFNTKLLSEMQFGGTNPVPEPATLGFLSLGLLSLWLARRRR